MFRNSSRFTLAAVLAAGTSIGAFALTGCERKETVLDVDTPGTDVEVERDVDTGEVEVETNNE